MLKLKPKPILPPTTPIPLAWRVTWSDSDHFNGPIKTADVCSEGGTREFVRFSPLCEHGFEGCATYKQPSSIKRGLWVEEGGLVPDVTATLCSVCFSFSKTNTRKETSSPTILPSNTVDALDVTLHPPLNIWSFTVNWHATEAARAPSAWMFDTNNTLSLCRLLSSYS